MGYQESLLYVELKWQFKRLIRAYEKAEQSGYYEVAGAQPKSVIILKQKLGELPAGSKLLWVCGEQSFHSLGGIFGGNLHGVGRYKIVPAKILFDGPDDPKLKGIYFDSPSPSENEHIKRYSVANYAYRLRIGRLR